MKIKCVILTIALIILCSCQKERAITLSDCSKYNGYCEWSWNGTSVHLQGVRDEYSNVIEYGEVEFDPNRDGYLRFKLSQSNDNGIDGERYLYVGNRVHNKTLVDYKTKDEIKTKYYSIKMSKEYVIIIRGYGVVVSDITITSDGHGGIDDNDNQGDGWEDDF